MAQLGLGGGMAAFQIGQSLGTGQSTLGAFVTQLTERMKSYDALRMKTEFETAGKIREAQVVEPIKAKAQMGAFQSLIAGELPGGTGAASGGGPGLVRTGVSFGPQGPTVSFGEAPEDKSQREVSEKVATQQATSGAEFESVALDVQNQARNLTAAWKALRAEAGGAGRVVGAQSAVSKELGELSPFGANPEVVAFEGQLTEMATSLVKMITGTSRPAASLIQQMRGTLPKVNSTDEEFFTQLRNTLHNTAARAAARQGQAYTPELRQQVEAMLQEILATVPASSAPSPGAQRTSSGVAYTVEP